MTATIVDTPTAYKNLKKFKGEAFLFKLDPPFKGMEYIIESSVHNETMYFESDKYGKPKNFQDIDFSFDTSDYEII